MWDIISKKLFSLSKLILQYSKVIQVIEFIQEHFDFTTGTYKWLVYAISIITSILLEPDDETLGSFDTRF